MLDTLIKNPTVVDGTGKPPYKADIGGVAGRIAILAENIEQEAKHTIEAQDLHLARTGTRSISSKAPSSDVPLART